jgi:transcriptional regulator with XRE-family HTH domain
VIGLQFRRDHAEGQPVASLHDVIANNVRGERARRRWTQVQLAEKLGWAQSSIYDIEVGRRKLTLDDLAALCAVFELPLLELCRGGEDESLRALGLR